MNRSDSYKIRVWDLPTRLFHWLSVSTLIIAWLTQGSSRYLDIHVFSGYLFLCLLVFRLLWGFIGSHYARFKSFSFNLLEVLSYLKSLWTPPRQSFLGHNPAGSWAIFALLGLGFLVSITGLLTLGGENHHGPFAAWLSFEQGEHIHKLHQLTAWLMLAIIIFHISGVLVASRLHHGNFIQAMIDGFKITTLQGTSVPSHDTTAKILIIGILVGSGTYFKGYLSERPYLPFVGPKLPENDLWRKVCGECHLAYHPSLLPARSWKKMMLEQDEHFEETLDLDNESVEIISEFLLTHAAESHWTKTAWKMDHSIPMDQAPQRITETSYWLQRHRMLTAEIWQFPSVKSKANCNACHWDAQAGTFEAAAMYLPQPSTGE